MYIVLAFLLLAILIVIHELGHFMAARMMKIEVREFSVGFGPRLLGRKSKKHGTDFSLRLIPLGGFCAFYGEDDTKGESKDDPRAFAKHNVWKRMFVILMGPVMNFVLAFLVGIVFFWCAGKPVPYITEVMANSPAQRAGLQAEDVITHVNGRYMLDGTVDTLLDTLGGAKEEDLPLELTVRRGGETVILSAEPEKNAETGKMQIGVYIGAKIDPVGFAEGFSCSWQMCVDNGGAILRALKGLIRGEGWNDTAGPVGIVSIISSEVAGSVEQGGTGAGANVFTQLLIMISINLGLMNLLPIPGLDGSRLVFGLIEVIRKKPVPPEKEAIVHLVGMALLLALMVFLTFKDVMRLFNPQQ